ncbi:hypothetical protein AMAG_11883 [Allomyces macrogynus ATCC 38327]|uniref:Uncharacterized protein n=1 Tax=Allomyces macrogynus (strain ATCC 38327) TaxID=578462 RepID=A0A0L0SY39_ALLM3|nr:hypothetical protein AMAG_11883 [Allomyces macrogynus ATCC 38327]|eukprot:KNE67422.1 hypothetical protein AMAG_11883 [Allomyces macrogynus ATCC 38327]
MSTSPSAPTNRTMPQTALITGATGGIGYATAKLFLERVDLFDLVIITGRSQAKADAAVASLRAETKCAPERLTSIVLELPCPDLDAVTTDLRRVLGDRKLDVLVNNAGAAATAPSSMMGVDATFAQNHLGVMALTLHLLPEMADDGRARIVTVASSLHTRVPDTLPDPVEASKQPKSAAGPHYDGLHTYSVSKLYNVWFARQLARLLTGTDRVASPTLQAHLARLQPTATSVYLCPGFIPTTGLARQSGFLRSILMHYVLPWFPFTTTVEDGAARILFAATATADGGGSLSGHMVQGKPPAVVDEVRGVPAHAKNVAKARECWNKSCEVLGRPEWKVVVAEEKVEK